MKTEGYTRDQVARVVELRATVEGLTLGPGVLDHLSAEGARRSLRYVYVLLHHLCLGFCLLPLREWESSLFLYLPDVSLLFLFARLLRALSISMLTD